METKTIQHIKDYVSDLEEVSYMTLQIKFKLGYQKAKRIIKELQDDGFISQQMKNQYCVVNKKYIESLNLPTYAS